MTYFDAARIPLICHIVHLMHADIVKGKSFIDFAFDLQNVIVSQLDLEVGGKVFPLASHGKMFPAILKNPEKYVIQ